jgi:cyanophycin synthetase
MELVEIRELDGPNVFLLQPAIKVEFKLGRRDLTRESLARLRARLEPLGFSEETTAGGLGALGDALGDAVRHLHRRFGLAEPELTWRELEDAGHAALAFAWERRAFALAAARLTADLALETADDLDRRLAELGQVLAERGQTGDEPEFVRDRDRRIPIVGITGTNGKTTTTRLCAHILRAAGKRVGWTSTAGVYVEGQQVLEGDYTGPKGAHRVLAEPGLDVAVLETARGGILLRGLAYESNDVGVFLNVSADHLGLLGIQTVEGLAQVKATVVRVTRPEGVAVLNADDPLVRGVAGSVRSPICYFSLAADSPAVVNHVAAGGAALFVEDGVVIRAGEGRCTELVRLDDVPVTFSGRAAHMVENALAAAAACLGLGVDATRVADGLRTFQSSPEHNEGRLNVFDLDGVTVIVDYAHNEAGLLHLLKLGRTMVGTDGKLVAVIGSAGDRSDDALRALGRAAGERSDEVVIKETQRYLRGRAGAGEMSALMADGVRAAGSMRWRVAPTELDGLKSALESRRAGDVVALMCIEQLGDVIAFLEEKGKLIS